MTEPIKLLLSILLGYLLGSISFSIILSRLRYQDDIRRHGSGNAGMTNTLRTYGKLSAALVLLGDAAKGMLAAWLGGLLAGPEAAYLAGLFAVVGHMFPLYFGPHAPPPPRRRGGPGGCPCGGGAAVYLRAGIWGIGGGIWGGDLFQPLCIAGVGDGGGTLSAGDDLGDGGYGALADQSLHHLSVFDGGAGGMGAPEQYTAAAGGDGE